MMKELIRSGLEQLGLTAGDLKIKEYELDDGVYEIEVVINGVAYEVDLNAVTGEIVDMDRYDDEDDDDHDDDDHNDRDDD